MPSENFYQYNEQIGPQDNNSLTRFLVLPQKKICGHGLLDDLCCSFNNTRCPADKEYYQPICVKEIEPAYVDPCEGDLTATFAFELTYTYAGMALYVPLVSSEGPCPDLGVVDPENIVVSGSTNINDLLQAFGLASLNAYQSVFYLEDFFYSINAGIITLTFKFKEGSESIFENFCGEAYKICAYDDRSILIVPDGEITYPINYVNPIGDIDEAGVVQCCESEEPDQTNCLPCGIENKTQGCGETDLLYFQFQMPDNFNRWGKDAPTHTWRATKSGNWLVTVEVYSPYCCNATFSDFASDYFVGATADGKTYQSIIIDPTLLPPEFSLKFTWNMGDGVEVVAFTEPYRRIVCDKTFVIEGYYPPTGRARFDCDGYFYGDVAYSDRPPFRHTNRFRVLGSLERDSFTVSREIIEKKRTTLTTRLDETYRLRTDLVPYYVIEKLRIILAGQTSYINGIQFDFSGDVSKSNEIGTMWLVDVKVKLNSACPDNYFNCD